MHSLPLVLAAVACRSSPDPASPAARGVIVVSIDTLRADHLGAYGYGRPTSPFLDSLSSKGVLFERAIAPYPMTIASHMSLFTGLYPDEHGIIEFAELAPEIATLPDRFREAGYRTAGFSEGALDLAGYGFGRGFERVYRAPEDRPDQADRTFAMGLEFLRGLGADERFFLFLHTYAPHTPYEAPEPWRDRFVDPAAMDPVPSTAGMEYTRAGPADLTDRQLAWAVARYDGEIAYTDGVLERFWSGVEGLGLGAATTLVVTADHGEAFLEHGRTAHGLLYQEDVHVPLLVVHPEVPAGRRGSLVQNVDIMPTLLDLAGLDPPASLSGGSLVPLLRDPTVAGRDRAISLTDYSAVCRVPPPPDAWPNPGGRGVGRSVWSITQGHVWHAVEHPVCRDETSNASETRIELFDVDADVAERNDVAASQADRLATLRAAIGDRPRPAVSPPRQLAPPPREAERLRALGYPGP